MFRFGQSSAAYPGKMIRNATLILSIGVLLMSCSRDVSEDDTTPSMVFRVCDQNRWNCRTPPPDVLDALNLATENQPIELDTTEGDFLAIGDGGTVRVPPGTPRVRGHIEPQCVDGSVSPPSMATFVSWMDRTFPGGRSQACGRDTYDWRCEGPWTEVSNGGVILCRWIYEPNPLGPESEDQAEVQQDFSATSF